MKHVNKSTIPKQAHKHRPSTGQPEHIIYKASYVVAGGDTR